jgi:hypothetical protein
MGSSSSKSKKDLERTNETFNVCNDIDTKKCIFSLQLGSKPLYMDCPSSELSTNTYKCRLKPLKKIGKILKESDALKIYQGIHSNRCKFILVIKFPYENNSKDLIDAGVKYVATFYYMYDGWEANLLDNKYKYNYYILNNLIKN